MRNSNELIEITKTQDNDSIYIDTINSISQEDIKLPQINRALKPSKFTEKSQYIYQKKDLMNKKKRYEAVSLSQTDHTFS